MGEDKLREEIAFIKNALEDGRDYARLRSPDFTVWGLAIALGYFGTYAHVTHLWSVDQGLIWVVPVALAWGFSLKGWIWGLLSGQRREPVSSPMIRTLRSVWLGYGITTTMIAIVAFTGTPHPDWFDTVTAGMLGLCFFISAAVSDIRWLRILAVGWWGAAILLFLIRDKPEQLLAGGFFMLALLFVPGLVLWLRRPTAHG
ncbi:MAG: hypothetical protein Q7T44_10450 [Parvibaculum sp.]|nr:hypothetical protein [Parvibaculum sp.]